MGANKIILGFVLGFLIVYVSGASASIIYQEDANATQCSGSWYDEYGFGCDKAYDANWNTYGFGRDPDNLGYYYANYTIPLYTTGAIWQTSTVKLIAEPFPTPVVFNGTVPQECLSGGILQFRVITADAYGIYWACWNYTSSDWTSRSGGAFSDINSCGQSEECGIHGYAYEEGVFWNISATYVDSCQTLSSNKIYVLNSSITARVSSSCLNMSSGGNVAIDGNGFGITITGTGRAISFTGIVNATIMNLTINGTYVATYGIYLSSVNVSDIDNVNVTAVKSGSGGVVYGINLNNITFKNSYFYNNSGTGLRFVNITNSLFDGVSIDNTTGNSLNGVHTISVSNSNVTNSKGIAFSVSNADNVSLVGVNIINSTTSPFSITNITNINIDSINAINTTTLFLAFINITDVSLTNSLINSKSSGVSITNTNNPIITGNVISSNSTGLSLTNVSLPTLSNNMINVYGIGLGTGLSLTNVNGSLSDIIVTSAPLSSGTVLTNCFLNMTNITSTGVGGYGVVALQNGNITILNSNIVGNLSGIETRNVVIMNAYDSMVIRTNINNVSIGSLSSKNSSIINAYNLTMNDAENITAFDNSMVNVYWNLDVRNPLGADVSIYDSQNNPVSQFSGDNVLWARQFFHNAGGITYMTPHKIEASKEGYWNLTAEITMDGNKQIILDMNPINIEYYCDFDGDGYKSNIVSVVCVNYSCIQTYSAIGSTTPGDDYDDSNPDINPGAIEVCNRIDDNCNGEVDENDPTPPTTTSDAPLEWRNSDVLVKLAATDEATGEVCGVQATYYCADQTDTCTPDTLGTEIIVTSEGISYARYLSVDNSGFGDGGIYSEYGNLEPVGSDAVRIDKTPPTIAGTRSPAPNVNGWNNADVNVHFECNDELSGIDSCTSDATISAEGTNHSLTGTAIDKAGNPANAVVSDVNIDKTKPTTTDDYAYDGIWSNNDAGITLTAADPEPGSGIDFTNYCIDNTGNCAPATDYTTPVSITTEGTSYLRYASKDIAENIEDTKQAVVMLDKTPPTATIEVSSAANAECSFWFQWWIDNGAISWDIVHGCADINAKIQDSVSGVKTYTLKLVDSNGSVVKESTNEPILTNFETAEKVWKVVVEAYDNANNYVTVSRFLYEDDDQDVFVLYPNGGAPDLFEQCPAEVPSVDQNKDGCQDTPGTNSESLSWCIDVYSGRADTSLNPTTVTTTFGTSYYKGSKLWNNLDSKINSGVETAYALNVIDKQGQYKDEIHCSIDATNLTTSSGVVLNYTKKDYTKLVYKNIKGTLRVKEDYHTHELSDGTRINAYLHYDENKDTSKLQLVYNNEDKKDACQEQARLDRDACKQACGKDKTCKKNCDATYKTDADKCRDTFQYTIKQEYQGYRTLSVYDIMKLVGYE